MERVCTADVQNMPKMMGSLSLVTNSDGGVIDDCIVTNAGDYIYMVINAGHEDEIFHTLKLRWKNSMAKSTWKPYPAVFLPFRAICPLPSCPVWLRKTSPRCHLCLQKT